MRNNNCRLGAEGCCFGSLVLSWYSYSMLYATLDIMNDNAFATNIRRLPKVRAALPSLSFPRFAPYHAPCECILDGFLLMHVSSDLLLARRDRDDSERA